MRKSIMGVFNTQTQGTWNIMAVFGIMAVMATPILPVLQPILS